MKNIFCCKDMEYYVREGSIVYDERFDEHGIPCGESSYIEIMVCPWCGKKLPISARDKWFEELEKMGFDDPFDQNIPIEYRSAQWRLNSNVPSVDDPTKSK